MVALRVDLPPELHQKLERVARERRVSPEEVVRESVRNLPEAANASAAGWTWPVAEVGGVREVPEELWRELANPGGEYLEREVEPK